MTANTDLGNWRGSHRAVPEPAEDSGRHRRRRGVRGAHRQATHAVNGVPAGRAAVRALLWGP
ncbi:hypothetical protein M0E87_08855 [Corynebacterium sp. CCM 9185]|uniref:Uncharacterized protein n=1 Tax=Corynebacterium marambiense TaxID=2765364 RepID=A0ABS0VXV0_9CORY|nr:hypothetical protein [Corynebacterium marambiense]MBI9001206.1 hypothetical protein [Corynebacterium marambiense]MCK7663765.1 hypothetical protein [Corynebacterium marambiense]